MKKLIAFSLILLVLSACSSSMKPTSAVVPTPAFTVTPLLAASPIPTNTSVLPTETSDAVSALVPEGQPASSEWNGIPIMPNAIAGDGDDERYVFTIKATAQQVQEYYQLELGKLGWQASATGDGDSSLMLNFMNKTSATLTVSIIAKGDEALVLLVK